VGDQSELLRELTEDAFAKVPSIDLAKFYPGFRTIRERLADGSRGNASSGGDGESCSNASLAPEMQ